MKQKMEKSNHAELMGAIAKLDIRQSVMEIKIDELVKKVAYQNGRVADSEAAIKKIVGEQTFEDGKRAGMSDFWKYLITIITVVIGIIVLLYGNHLIK